MEQGSGEALSYLAEQPAYLVESFGYIPDDLSPGTRAGGIGTHYYRITARGTGGHSGNDVMSPNQKMLQSIFAKRYN